MRRLVLAWVVLLATAAHVDRARADAARTDAHDLERQVKAAYLYKFASYVDWPKPAFPAAETPLTIGVLGDDELAEALERTVVGRTSGGRPVEVVRLKPGAPLPALHILFVARSEEARLRADVRAAAGRPVLVVTETPGALSEGSMINFVLEREHVRFEVALAPADAAGLTLSSRLLAVARAVTSGRS